MTHFDAALMNIEKSQVPLMNSSKAIQKRETRNERRREGRASNVILNEGARPVSQYLVNQYGGEHGLRQAI